MGVTPRLKALNAFLGCGKTPQKGGGLRKNLYIWREGFKKGGLSQRRIRKIGPFKVPKIVNPPPSLMAKGLYSQEDKLGEAFF